MTEVLLHEVTDQLSYSFAWGHALGQYRRGATGGHELGGRRVDRVVGEVTQVRTGHGD
jgi:hypothetical protein